MAHRRGVTRRGDEANEKARFGGPFFDRETGCPQSSNGSMKMKSRGVGTQS